MSRRETIPSKNTLNSPASSMCSKASPSTSAMAYQNFDADEWGLTDPRPSPKPKLTQFDNRPSQKPVATQFEDDDDEWGWADPPTERAVIAKIGGGPPMDSDSSDDDFGIPISTYKNSFTSTPTNHVSEEPIFPVYKPVTEVSTNGMSKKAQRTQNYFQNEKAARQFRDRNDIIRPQSISKDFFLRARQINTGFVQFTYHPMNQLVRNWIPNDTLLTAKAERVPYALTRGKPTPKWVGTAEELTRMIEKLMRCDRVGFDLEGHNDDTKHGYVALLQLSSREFGDFTVDAIGLQHEIRTVMKPLLESLSPLKIMFDVANDVRNIQKMFDIFVIGIIDLQAMYSLGNHCPPISLKNLCNLYFPNDKNLKNPEQTLSDWSVRPLTRQQVVYATNDSHYIMLIYDKMLAKLNEMGATGHEFLLKAFETSKDKSLVLWESPARRRKDWTDMAINVLADLRKRDKNNEMKSRDEVPPPAMKNFANLVEWRFRLSDVLDKKDHNVVSAVKLLHLSKLVEPTKEDIEEVLGKEGRQLTKQTNQIPIILDILNPDKEKGKDFMEFWRNFRCNNCNKVGHGAVWACPFPKNKDRKKEYYANPENREKYLKDQRRRRLNVAKNKKAKQLECQKH